VLYIVSVIKKVILKTMILKIVHLFVSIFILLSRILFALLFYWVSSIENCLIWSNTQPEMQSMYSFKPEIYIDCEIRIRVNNMSETKYKYYSKYVVGLPPIWPALKNPVSSVSFSWLTSNSFLPFVECLGLLSTLLSNCRFPSLKQLSK